ncbi:hypothetical protein LSAT2_012233 [Lamellibrachia satsuma]|nr:hypothetical protein LSAT2_012233 [Lamellibrachia satsuma]
MEGQNHKRRNLEKNGTSKSRRRSPDQEKKLGHTRRKPTSSVGNGREEDPARPGEGLWRLRDDRWDTPGASWKFCSRQDQVEEACGRPMLHTEYKGISQVKYILAYRVRDNPRGVLNVLSDDEEVPLFLGRRETCG